MLINSSPFNKSNINTPKTVEVKKHKIKILPDELTLQLLRSKDIGYTYSVEFLITLSSKKRTNSPFNNLSLKDLDLNSLKFAILSNIKDYDRQYMDLVSFDHSKAIFHLKVNKWIKDTTNQMRQKTKLGSFKMYFKLKQAPPRMIFYDALRFDWNNFMIRKIRQWFIENKRKEKQMLGSIFPRSLLITLRQKITNMFDWSYDPIWNTIEAKLQSKWIIALLYATSELTKKESLSKLQAKSKKYKFSPKEINKIEGKNVNTKKWKEIINNKFYKV
jgi:hypothetical protein